MQSLRQQEDEALSALGFSDAQLVMYATIRTGWGQLLNRDVMAGFFGNRGVLLVMTETKLSVITDFAKPNRSVEVINLAETSAWSLSAQLNYFVVAFGYHGKALRFGIQNDRQVQMDGGRTAHSLQILIENGFFAHLPRIEPS